MDYQELIRHVRRHGQLPNDEAAAEVIGATLRTLAEYGAHLARATDALPEEVVAVLSGRTPAIHPTLSPGRAELRTEYPNDAVDLAPERIERPGVWETLGAPVERSIYDELQALRPGAQGPTPTDEAGLMRRSEEAEDAARALSGAADFVERVREREVGFVSHDAAEVHVRAVLHALSRALGEARTHELAESVPEIRLLWPRARA